MSCCCQNTYDERKEKLIEIAKKHCGTKGALIAVLHEAQELYGYLPVEAQEVISKHFNVPMTEIYGVITFYSQFSLKEKGECRIAVCMGTACYVKGSAPLLDRLKEKLGINVGECTADKKFSLEACRCIGACGLAPVLTINKDVYGRLEPKDVDRILDLYK